MKKMSSNLFSVLDSLGCDESLIKKNRRAIKVRKMWAEIVEDFFLEHTNSVFILNENNQKTLIVYVDESIFAAELNGRRELIKLEFLKKFNEEIDEFKICISRGSYKKNYPFKEIKTDHYKDDVSSVPLTEDEIKFLYSQTESIKNIATRNALLKAMISDLEWKKGINDKNPKKE